MDKIKVHIFFTVFSIKNEKKLALLNVCKITDINKTQVILVDLLFIYVPHTMFWTKIQNKYHLFAVGGLSKAIPAAYNTLRFYNGLFWNREKQTFF